MSISCNDEKFPVSELPLVVPARQGGRRIHVATGYRWATTGVRGVILETVAIGGTLFTSREALAQFIDAKTKARQSGIQTTPAQQAAIRKAREELRRKRSEKAAARLERAGC